MQKAQNLSWPMKSWLVFYAFSAWLIVSVLLVTDIPLHLIYQYSQKEDEADNREIRVLLENENPDEKKEKKEAVFLSNKDATARGKLTEKKKYEAKAFDHVLSLPRSGNSAEVRTIQILKNQEFRKMEDEGFKARTVKQTKAPGQTGVQNGPGEAAALKVPAHYVFRDQFALSWDARGRPQIPTKNFEHYSYFRKMLDKIQNYWAPPGGNPSPVYGDSYHRMSLTPGTMRYSAFPNQDVRIVFVLDDSGEVGDVKIHSSLGYSSLDASLVEAIERARNFGPPPGELLNNGILIVPIIFRIIVR